MKLIKVKNGLLEVDNFFLASPFNDFSGGANVSRDISTGKLKLISNDKIERRFNFSSFVLEVDKENFNNYNADDYCLIYLGNDDYLFGIKDNEVDTQNKHWKIISSDGYIQTYGSNDGINYNHLGGMEFSLNITKQGFQKHHADGFILNNYRLYSTPYITLQNLPEGTICELHDSNNNLLKTRVFDVNLECNIYLDHNNLEGHFVFKDISDNVIYVTDNLIIQYGDVWIISPYNIEILYLGNTVTNVNSAILQDLDEIISLKNVGDTAYSNLIIGTETSSNDLIEISLDGINYNSTQVINLSPGSEINIYVKITKNVDNPNFGVRDFQMVIQE